MPIKKLKLITIRDDEVFFTDTDLLLQRSPLDSFSNGDIMRHFSIEDQEIINNATVDDGVYIGVSNTGKRMLVPYKRHNYIFFFVAIFTLSIIMTVFNCIRYIQVGNTTLYGAFLFFPLAFASTDIINELYGYNRVRVIIQTTVLALIIMGALMAISLMLNGTLTNGESDAPFRALLGNIPLLIILSAFTLFVSDSINAFIYHKIRSYLQGKALWLRSIISTFIAHFINSIIIMFLVIQTGILDLPLNKVLDVLFSGHWVKMIYAICSLPFIYAAVNFVKNKEKEELRKGNL